MIELPAECPLFLANVKARIPGLIQNLIRRFCPHTLFQGLRFLQWI